MPEVAEETVAEPTNEQVEAAIGGQGPEAEVKAAPVAAPEPLTQDSIRKMFEEMINPLKSELGQTRKLRSDFDQFRQSAPKQEYTPPKSWAELDPASQKATAELIEHVFNQKYGQDFNGFKQMQSELQQTAQINKVVNLTAQLAGADYKDLDPIMGSIYEEHLKRAQSGDEEAQELVNEFETTRAGAQLLVVMAKEARSKSLQGQQAQVQAQAEAKAKRAGTSVSQAAPQAQGDWQANMPTNTKERLEYLKNEMAKRGVA